MNYVLLTDSTCDIPLKMADQHNIDVLPFTINVDGKDYVEREDFTFEEYYEMLLKCEGVPKTAQITMMRFEEAYEKYAAAGCQQLLYVSICGAGSNTFNAATMAKENYFEHNPDSQMQIYIVDSHTYSMGYGYPVCEAAKKLKNGADMDTVIAYLERTFARTEIALAAFTLKFIKKSGRVSAAAAFAGELLGLRPIIDLTQGKSTTVAKVRGDTAVMPALIKRMKARYTFDDGGYYIIGGTDMGNCKMLAKMCKKEFGKAPEDLFLLGAAVATNTGPNALAIVYCKRDDV